MVDIEFNQCNVKIIHIIIIWSCKRPKYGKPIITLEILITKVRG